jgi:hypothetical protein
MFKMVSLSERSFLFERGPLIGPGRVMGYKIYGVPYAA